MGRSAVTGIRPSYPVAALRADQEGWVVLGFDVEEGKVVHGKVLDSSPPELFDQTTLQWVSDNLSYPSGKSAKSCWIEYVWKMD
ncbi:energy transducer TonB [Niveibacterium terrae]|uniref:energy transducer TonB n=1 Tax=Niveibacterium terrae TaxID=3373598 RepID=UPI003A9070EF